MNGNLIHEAYSIYASHVPNYANFNGIKLTPDGQPFWKGKMKTGLVSFSLWGSNPVYIIGAIKNCKLCKSIYPNWDVIVYLDDTIQPHIQEDIRQYAMVVNMTGRNIPGSFWRFLAADIHGYDRSIFRDCDSRVSEREASAVNEWIETNTTLHVMRDHPGHGRAYGAKRWGMLAGMWGIKNRKVKFTEMITDYCKDKTQQYGLDQNFLEPIYDHFKNDVCEHDEFFGGRKFPIKRIGQRFIGEKINYDDEPLTTDHLMLQL